LPKPVTMPFEAELADVVGGQRAELLERALVEQQRQPLARGELAARVLLLDALLAAAEHRPRAQLAQRLQLSARAGLVHRPLPLHGAAAV
jgi:hypothetical protein